MTSLYVFLLLMTLGSIGALFSSGALIQYYAVQQGAEDFQAITTKVYLEVFIKFLSKLLIACTVGAAVNQWTNLNLAPHITSLIEGYHDWPNIWHHVRSSLIFGMHTGFIMSLFYIFVYPYIIPAAMVSILTQLRQCQKMLPRLFFEGVLTEIIIRWGLLSAIYGVIDIAFGKLWWVQFVAVLSTAMLHASSILPNLYSLYRNASPMDLFTVWIVQSVIGCVFGWIFIWHGLLSVMLAHISYEVACLLVERYRPRGD